jgi:hypothetical protein
VTRRIRAWSADRGESVAGPKGQPEWRHTFTRPYPLKPPPSSVWDEKYWLGTGIDLNVRFTGSSDDWVRAYRDAYKRWRKDMPAVKRGGPSNMDGRMTCLEGKPPCGDNPVPAKIPEPEPLDFGSALIVYGD